MTLKKSPVYCQTLYDCVAYTKVTIEEVSEQFEPTTREPATTNTHRHICLIGDLEELHSLGTYEIADQGAERDGLHSLDMWFG